MTTTEQDLRALAYLAQRLRTETHGAKKWDDAGLWPVLKRLEGHNLALTVERVTRHAQDPEARTPAAIERPFIPDAPRAGVKFPMKAGDPDECRTHRGQHRDHCSGCAADQKAATHADLPQTGMSMQEALEAARAALRAGRQETT